MDTAVALVNAYLQLNAYLTVTEYPILELHPKRGNRTVSDLDILAFRFANTEHQLHSKRKRATFSGDAGFRLDPALGAPEYQPDMIVGEVKRGHAHFNTATRNPEVLATALIRFGCCHQPRALELAGNLIHRGHVTTEGGHSVRMIAFGSVSPDDIPRGWRIIPLPSILEFLSSYLHDHWEALHQVQFGNPVLDILSIIERGRALSPDANETDLNQPKT